MPKEKIGSDVLGKRRAPRPYPLIPEELQKKLEKLAEERKRRLEELGIREDETRKIRQLEEEGKLPRILIPGDLPHERKPGEPGYDKLAEEVEKKLKKPKKTKVKVTKTKTYEL